jgi:hypothetical protein
MPVLDGDDEALVASLLADDPSDFHVARARIWRIGAARWSANAPDFGPRPSGMTAGLEQAVEVVVVDPQGPRVLLPLAELDQGAPPPSWSALRLVAQIEASDLVAGLERELHPTPWLTLAGGVGLTPIEHEGDHLLVAWADPACGFGLELALDEADFGPLYEPGPSGRPSDEPELDETSALRLAPGTAIFADVEGHEPVVRLDPEPRESERLRAAQRVRVLGKPSRKLQSIELRCHGVIVTGYVAPTSIIELPGRFAVVEAARPASSTCADFPGEPVLVPRATTLHEPANPASLVGVVATDVELDAKPSTDGWWTACVPSPWGDLIFDLWLGL